ncbi:hypothetical protein MBLNU459_g3703t1 [Dothideomycetes sp. NU459]
MTKKGDGWGDKFFQTVEKIGKDWIVYSGIAQLAAKTAAAGSRKISIEAAVAVAERVTGKTKTKAKAKIKTKTGGGQAQSARPSAGLLRARASRAKSLKPEVELRGRRKEQRATINCIRFPNRAHPEHFQPLLALGTVTIVAFPDITGAAWFGLRGSNTQKPRHERAR